MRQLLKRLVREEQGQDVIEYALLAAGISVVLIPLIPGFGAAIGDAYTRIQARVATLAP